MEASQFDLALACYIVAEVRQEQKGPQDFENRGTIVVLARTRVAHYRSPAVVAWTHLNLHVDWWTSGAPVIYLRLTGEASERGPVLRCANWHVDWRFVLWLLFAHLDLIVSSWKTRWQLNAVKQEMQQNVANS